MNRQLGHRTFYDVYFSKKRLTAHQNGWTERWISQEANTWTSHAPWWSIDDTWALPSLSTADPSTRSLLPVSHWIIKPFWNTWFVPQMDGRVDCIAHCEWVCFVDWMKSFHTKCFDNFRKRNCNEMPGSSLSMWAVLLTTSDTKSRHCVTWMRTLLLYRFSPALETSLTCKLSSWILLIPMRQPSCMPEKLFLPPIFSYFMASFS
jgi:hypothetical protein